MSTKNTQKERRKRLETLDKNAKKRYNVIKCFYIYKIQKKYIQKGIAQRACGGKDFVWNFTIFTVKNEQLWKINVSVPLRRKGMSHAGYDGEKTIGIQTMA